MYRITTTLTAIACAGALSPAFAIEPLSDLELDTVQGGVADTEIAVPVAGFGNDNTATSEMNDTNGATNDGGQQIIAQDNAITAVDQSHTDTNSHNDSSTDVDVDLAVHDSFNDNSSVDSHDDNSLDFAVAVSDSYNDNSTNDDSTHLYVDNSQEVELGGNAQQNAQALFLVNTLGDVGSAVNVNSTSLSAGGDITNAASASAIFNQVSANWSIVAIGGGL